MNTNTTELQSLINEIESRVGKNPALLELVLPEFKLDSYKHGQYLFTSTEKCNYIYFVVTGCIQVTTTNIELEEKVTDLIIENQWFTDIQSFLTGTASTFSAVSYKHSTVFKIHKNSFDKLMVQVPKFAEAYLRIIESKYQESVQRISAFGTFNSKEKIRWLRQHQPNFENNLPDRLIAAYLGMSKETYCRQKQK